MSNPQGMADDPPSANIFLKKEPVHTHEYVLKYHPSSLPLSFDWHSLSAEVLMHQNRYYTFLMHKVYHI